MPQPAWDLGEQTCPGLPAIWRQQTACAGSSLLGHSTLPQAVCWCSTNCRSSAAAVVSGAMVKRKERPEDKPVTDKRFAAVHTDPRFQRLPKAQRKVQIDDRFKGSRLCCLINTPPAAATPL